MGGLSSTTSEPKHWWSESKLAPQMLEHFPPLKRNTTIPDGQTTPDYDFFLKVLVIGLPFTGKSSLLKRIQDDEFDPAIEQTHLLEMVVHDLDYKGLKVKFGLFGAPGWERTRSHLRAYYRGSHALLICFDLGDVEMVERTIEKWLQDVRYDTYPRFISLVGTKADLCPSLIYEPWNEARTLLAATQSLNPTSAFAQLPLELLHCIVFLSLEVSCRMRGLSGIDWIASQLSLKGSRVSAQMLEDLSAKFHCPVYLTSAKGNLGINELMHSVFGRILESHFELPDELRGIGSSSLCIDASQSK